MKLGKFILPLIFVIGLTAYLSLFTVKEINQAIVLQFGDPKKVIVQAGLQWKIPFIQNVVFLDRRIFKFRSSTRRSDCIRSKKINRGCIRTIQNRRSIKILHFSR